MSSNHRRLVVSALALVALSLTVACGKPATKPEAPPAKTASEPQVTSTAPASSADIDAKLAKADAADGSVDKVVASCAGCGLAMAGHAEHAAECRGYQLHFCSAHCKTSYDKNGEKMIEALPIN